MAGIRRGSSTVNFQKLLDLKIPVSKLVNFLFLRYSRLIMTVVNLISHFGIQMPSESRASEDMDSESEFQEI